MQVNNDLISNMEQTIEEEEKEDNQLRAQHGQRWTRMPSASVNGQYKQSLFDYKQKMQMAGATDAQIKQKFESNKSSFDLLSKTRADVAAMIPKSATSD